LTSRVVAGLTSLSAGDGAIENWAEQRRPQVLRSEQLLTELQAGTTPDLAMLAVANRQLRSMVSD
jgi:glutamate dehydrogenase